MLSIGSLAISYKSYQLNVEANKIAIEANRKANLANNIAVQANTISEKSLLIADSSSVSEKRQRSMDIVEKVYDFLYENDKYKKEIDSLRDYGTYATLNNFKLVIDQFEGLGIKYCNGLVTKENIQGYLGNTFIYICDSEKVYSVFRDKKNATALLCKILYPDTIFASSVNKKTIDTCPALKH